VSALAAYGRMRAPVESVSAWLLRIARNEIIDRGRRQTRSARILARFFADGSEADHRVNVESEVVVRDELRRVIAVMANLSERDRSLVGLRLAAGLSYAEVGAVLGLSEHAATVATRRALDRLRAQLEGRS